MNTQPTIPYDESFGIKPPENYEQYFVPLIGEPVAKDQVRLADLHEGEKILDVACGTGIVARLAEAKAGPEGTVTGVDINPGMLAVARALTSGGSIRWHEASAEDMPFPDESYDMVMCQMGLQFMEDKVAALREMHRVLVSGGRLVLNVPGRAGEAFRIMAQAMERHISPEAGGFVRQVFSLNDPGEIDKLASDAGFVEVNVSTRNKTFTLSPPGQFLWQYIHSTPLAGVLAEVDEEVKKTFEEEVTGQWQAFVDDGSFIYEQPIIFVTARKGKG